MIRVGWGWSTTVGLSTFIIGGGLGLWLFEEWPARLLFGLIGGVPLALLFHTSAWSLRCDDHGLTLHTWLGRAKARWSQVSAWRCMRDGGRVVVVEGPGTEWLELTGPFGTWRVLTSMDNYGQLISMIEAHGRWGRGRRPDSALDRWLARGTGVWLGLGTLGALGFLLACVMGFARVASGVSTMVTDQPLQTKTMGVVAGVLVGIWWVGSIALSGWRRTNLLRRPGRAATRGAVATLAVGCLVGAAVVVFSGAGRWDVVFGALVLAGMFGWEANGRSAWS